MPIADPTLKVRWNDAVESFVVQGVPSNEDDFAQWNVGASWASAVEVIFSAIANPVFTPAGHSAGKNVFASTVGHRRDDSNPVGFKTAMANAFSAYAALAAVPANAVPSAGSIPPVVPPPAPPVLDPAFALPQSDSVIPFADAILDVVKVWLATGTVATPAGSPVPWI